MNNLATINPDVETKLRISAKDLIEKADEIVIFTRNDLSVATDICFEIKRRIKTIEEERVKIVKPINEGVNQVNNNFKSIRVPLEDAETRLKSSMLKFQQAERRKLEDEQHKKDEESRKAAEEEQKKAGHNNLNEAPAPVIPAASFKPSIYGQTGATSTLKKMWKYDLIDIVMLAAARPY